MLHQVRALQFTASGLRNAQEPVVRTEEERSLRRSRWSADIRQALSLDDRQLQEVERILFNHEVSARGFWNDTRASYCDMLGELRRDVRELLEPEQVPLFEERIQRIDEKMRRRHQRSREEPEGKRR